MKRLHAEGNDLAQKETLVILREEKEGEEETKAVCGGREARARPRGGWASAVEGRQCAPFPQCCAGRLPGVMERWKFVIQFPQ